MQREDAMEMHFRQHHMQDMRQLQSCRIEKGADINAQRLKYGNALQTASKGGHIAIVKLFLEKGADINAQGGEYGNALQAASYEGHSAIVQLLIEKGADVNA